MNKRIMKKKYNKWEIARMYNITLSFDDVSFVFDAFCAKMNKDITNPMDTYPNEFQKFAASKNVMRAIKSYCKKYVWHSGACDNIRDMYRYMCEEIHNEREYEKRIEEQMAQLTPEDFENVKEEWEHRQRCYDALGIL